MFSYSSSPILTSKPINDVLFRIAGTKASLSVHVQRTYEAALYRHELIRDAKIHIVVNPDELDLSAASEILFAMLHNKPILILQPPRFSNSIPAFVKATIMSRLGKLSLCDVNMLDENDFSHFMSSMETISSINYTLTKNETALIKSYVRSYFRGLI